MRIVLVALVALLALGSTGKIHSQTPPKPLPGDPIINKYLERHTMNLADRILAGATNKEEWEARRPELKKQLYDMLGLWPLPEKTPLKATTTGVVENDGVRIEKLHFQSKPGLYVTANLYLPKEIKGKLPAILYVCGHSSRGDIGGVKAVSFFQQHAMWYATNGYAFLIVDTIEKSEIRGVTHRGTNHGLRWWWQSMGYTPAGVECWNGIRALDYLQSRPEIDPDRIGVTGISGGGSTTLYVAAADERVKAAVPVSGLTDSESYITHILPEGWRVIDTHCDCVLPINTFKWEMTTVPAMIAPRPLLIINSAYDKYFPMPGNERVRVRMERLYKFYYPRAHGMFEIGITPGGHALQTPNYVGDHPEQRLMAFRFMNTHLKRNPDPVQDRVFPVLDPEKLRVFPVGGPFPDDSWNGRVDENFVPREYLPLPRNQSESQDWRMKQVQRLKDYVFPTWPERVEPARRNEGTVETEPGIIVSAHEYAILKDAERFMLIVLNQDDDPGIIPPWAKSIIQSTDSVVLLSPRGCGDLKWTRVSPPNYVERAHVLLGRTVDAGRVWDVQATARMMAEKYPGRSVCVVGRGQAGIICAYAALFEPRIDEIVAVSPPASHMKGPQFINVLRYMDIPEVLGLLAHKKLSLIGTKDGQFDQTKKIFRATGAEGNLSIN